MLFSQAFLHGDPEFLQFYRMNQLNLVPRKLFIRNVCIHIYIYTYIKQDDSLVGEF